ncbi:shTK domain protein [Dictyocaulus viviparus]|uniref:Zinc metalloproteinase n=1 Tax=Dictyocaulus viviparus TaxID=29172 RepID=A0A0D8Y707_DICVI|nr:shTK domain protein [Dictyocaulus viviparus]
MKAISSADNAKRVFKKAAEAWQEATCIDFKEDNSAKDKINVIYGSGCYSSVGRIGGNQTLSLGKGCETVGTALHEIGHALGMYHTQCRHDRDDFIIIQEKNVRNGWMSQLTKESKDKNYNYELSYDYGSVMHYGSRSASKNGLPMMVPRHDMNYLLTLGSDTISFYDKLMMNFHYGCLTYIAEYSSKCDNVCPTKCQNGGFPHPRNCSKCICPSGYGGDFCNERPSGCGEILNATTSYQTLTVTLGNPRSRQAKDVGEVCNYWIQGPTRSRIEVVLESYEGRVTSDGCVYAGVEIKTREDKRQTGYKFCSKNNSRTTLVSTYNVVPLTVYNRLLSNTVVVKYRISNSRIHISNSSLRTISSSQNITDSTQSGIPHSTTETSPCLTFNPPTFTSRRTRATTTIPKSTPKTRCREQTVCPMLVKTGFCRDPKYDVITIKMVCPASCGYC